MSARRIFCSQVLGTTLAILASVGLVSPTAAIAADAKLEALFTSLASDGPKRSNFYELRRLSEIELPLESRGTLEFDPPATLRKITTEPITEQLELNESVLSVTIAGTTRELPVDAVPAAGALAGALRGLLAGRLADVQKHFSISFVTEETDWQMDLSPLKSAVSTVLKKMVVRGSSAQIRQIEIIQTNGDESVMQILASD